ncbi:hypothetical protein [Streptomyces sp. NPDC051636]|uniref:hypothetical protein n=1 Tax=Streptomyces sp. NPDC051636 TaxID=3365663 RepID=UPI0037AA5FEB
MSGVEDDAGDVDEAGVVEPVQHTSYGWAQALAQAGYDVFMMDLQGSGRSPRPRMEDPCNVNSNQQSAVRPPLLGPRDPSYPF